jgi:hypothetical protein
MTQPSVPENSARWLLSDIFNEKRLWSLIMTAPKRAKKTGRPTVRTQKLQDEICAELASGKSVRTICKRADMPGMETIFRWLRENMEFREQYARAKAEAADALVEEMLDIADDGRNDWMEVHDKDGACVGFKINGEHVQRSRLRVDTRKWVASKLKPKKYGERVDMNHGVQPENPLAELIRSIQGSSLRPVAKPAENDDKEVA